MAFRPHRGMQRSSSIRRGAIAGLILVRPTSKAWPRYRNAERKLGGKAEALALRGGERPGSLSRYFADTILGARQGCRPDSVG